MTEDANRTPAVTEKRLACYRLPFDFADLHNIEKIIPTKPRGQIQHRHAHVFESKKSGTASISGDPCSLDAMFCACITCVA